MRAEIDSISAEASSAGTKPRVLYEVGYDDTTGAIYAPADDVVPRRDGDARRRGDRSRPVTRTPTRSRSETLIAEDPQIIVLADESLLHADAGRGREATWLGCHDRRPQRRRPAGRDIEITRPGPRLPLGLRNLVGAIWPDLTLPAAS